MRSGRYLILLLTFVVSLGVLLAYSWWPIAARTPVALAHAYVIGSDPVDGSTISSAPSVVRIFFNEAIGPASAAHVFGPDGSLVDAARSSISRNDPRELDTPLSSPGSLPQGGYTIRWTALSNEDGHTTHGVIGFNLGQSSVGLPGETILGPSTSNILPQLDVFGVLSVAWDWLVMLALTFWVGILVMEALVLARPTAQQEPAPETENPATTLEQTSTLLMQASRQTLPLQWLALAVLLVGEFITIVLRATSLTQTLGGSGINLRALGQVIFETNYGYLWLVRFALIVTALGLLWWTTRRQPSMRTMPTKRSSNRIGQLRQQIREQGILEENSTPDLEPTDDEAENHTPTPPLAPARSATTFQDVAEPDGEHTDLTSEHASVDLANDDLAPIPSLAEASPATTFQDATEPGGEDRELTSDHASDDRVSANLTPAPLAPTQHSVGPARGATTLARSGLGEGLSPAVKWVMLTLAALILLTYALTSDAAQLAQPHISAVVLDWIYLAAQNIWFGALAYLGYVLLPLLLIVEPHQHAGTMASMLRHITPWALGTIAALIISGLFVSESSLSSAQQLFSDPYGRALLVKIALIVFMLILSGYTLFVIRPKLAHQAALLPVVDVELPTRRTRQSALEKTAHRLGRTLKLQTWLGAGVLLCAALMTFYAPPIVFPPNSYSTSTSGNASSTTNINAQTKQVGNLTVTLEVLPGRVDYDNTVIVTINDSHGNPVTDALVQLSTNMEIMDMGTAHMVVKGGNPTYIATFNKDAAFTMLGKWDVNLRITRPNQAAVQALFKVTLGE